MCGAPSYLTSWCHIPRRVFLSADCPHSITGLIKRDRIPTNGVTAPLLFHQPPPNQTTSMHAQDGATFPCSFHILHYASSVECEMNMEMRNLSATQTAGGLESSERHQNRSRPDTRNTHRTQSTTSPAQTRGPCLDAQNIDDDTSYSKSQEFSALHCI